MVQIQTICKGLQSQSVKSSSSSSGSLSSISIRGSISSSCGSSSNNCIGSGRGGSGRSSCGSSSSSIRCKSCNTVLHVLVLVHSWCSNSRRSICRRDTNSGFSNLHLSILKENIFQEDIYAHKI